MCLFVFPDLLKVTVGEPLQEAGAGRRGAVNSDQRHAYHAFFDVD
jgi:hypothetical protein